MAIRPRKKRIMLVNRDFQFRYAGAGLVAGLTSTLITATLIIYPLFVFKILTVNIFLPWPIIVAICIAIIMNAIMQMFFGVLLTHRIAGPMFSLVRHLRLIEQGHWNIKMRQREGDELDIVVRHLNELSESLTKTTKDDIGKIAKTIKLTDEDTNTQTNQMNLIRGSLVDIKDGLERRIVVQGGMP